MTYKLLFNLESQDDDGDIQGLISHCFELIFGLYMLANYGTKEAIQARVSSLDEKNETAEIEVIISNVVNDTNNKMYKFATGQTIDEELKSNRTIYEYIRGVKSECIEE